LTVLFITHKYPPAVGGMENQSYHLIQGISELTTAYHIIFDSKEPIWKFFFRLRWRVKKMLKDHPEITHIHLNDGLMAAFCFLLRVDFEGRKVVATFHGLDVVFPLGVYQKYIFRRMVQKVDKIICVSTATQDACYARNIPKEKITVVHNGVDVHWKNNISEDKDSTFKKYNLGLTHDKIILTLGRPVKRKGFSWFAYEVMPLLEDHIKMVHIGHIATLPTTFLQTVIPKSWENKFNLFMGKADDSAALLAAHHKNSDKIILAGRLSDADRDSLIACATVVVMPNVKVEGDMEGFGLVALEAAVMGKTVLVSDLEGMKDAIINGKNGYRIPSGNAQMWADAIHHHIENHTLTGEDIKAFTTQNYSWEKMCLGYVAEMENM
jgi:glycosyltransferase involved in cell wall biosynthesis